MSLEEVTAKHRKELKALEGEKRAALKKAKTTAGKKAKEKLAEVEVEFAAKLKDLSNLHAKELAELSGSADAVQKKTEASENQEEQPIENESAPGVSPDEERERKQAKARRKREKAREKERERELQIERENAEAGPSLRQIEVEQIKEQLVPLGLEIAEIPSDGHCLYRAVSAHLGNSYQEIRNLCADALIKGEAEFAPFCEFDEKAPDFESYVARVRKSSDWGGHLELRALSVALSRHIIVYSAQSKEPLHIKPDNMTSDDDDDPIRLSYHLHYYALGEHYNQVVKSDG